MNVKKIKEFVKEHKGEIVYYTCAAVVGGVLIKRVACPTWTVGKTFTSEKEADEYLSAMNTINDAWNTAREGATVWGTVNAAELAERVNGNVYTYPDGTIGEITGAILFGNKVEA